MINFNSTGNGMLAPPFGYPVRLAANIDTYASGVMPAQFSTVTAVLSADTTAQAHLAIAMAPVVVGGSDLQIIAQTDVALTSSRQMATVSLPSTIPQASQNIGGGKVTAGAKAVVAATFGTFSFVIITNADASVTTYDDGSMTGYQAHVDGDNDSSGKPIWYTITALQNTLVATISTAPANTVSGALYLRPPYARPTVYIVKLWVDGLADRTPDLVARQSAAGYSIAQNPGIVNGVTLYSVQLS